MVLFFHGNCTARALAEVPWEEYRPQLEIEYIIPFVFYDGGWQTITYGRMSSVLRDQELQFFLLADQTEDILYYVLGYTRHHYKWSTGINLYSMPVNGGPLWNTAFWEEQTGISLLACYRRTNETRLNLRVQWERFDPMAVASSFPEPVEAGTIFGWEATALRDNFSFLAQSGNREYISLGGAFPVLGTDYYYFKLEGDRRSYHSFSDRISALVSLRGGKIWGRYPLQRGFMIGGIQQANMSGLGNLVNEGTFWELADSVLRGYPLYRFNGDGFLLGNIELRTLLYPDSYYNIRNYAVVSSFFLDAGQIWKNDLPLNLEPPASWGIGIKFFLGGLLLGIDYAMPLNPEEKPCWHFSLGEVF